MKARGRRLAIFLPVVVTVLLAGVIGVLVVVQSQAQSDQVAQADGLAEDFLSDVGSFRADVLAALEDVDVSDPAALRAALEKAIEDAPSLEDAPDYGREQSEAYAAAVDAQQTFLEPYQRLRRELRRAEVALAFIRAAREVLELRASDYVGFGLLEDSAAVRSRLIPAFVAARDRFAAVRVPRGQDELAATVRGAAQFVIDRATTLAASIDADRSFSFTYGDEFQAASVAVDDYATTVNGDLTEAVNALTQ